MNQPYFQPLNLDELFPKGARNLPIPDRRPMDRRGMLDLREQLAKLKLHHGNWAAVERATGLDRKQLARWYQGSSTPSYASMNKLNSILEELAAEQL